MASLIVGTIGAGLVGVFVRTSLRQAAKNGKILSPFQAMIAGKVTAGGGSAGGPSSGIWEIGGFQGKMDKREASQILGLKSVLALFVYSRTELIMGCRDSQLTPKRVKDAHRKIMLANHPDRGGSPYMASK